MASGMLTSSTRSFYGAKRAHAGPGTRGERLQRCTYCWLSCCQKQRAAALVCSSPRRMWSWADPTWSNDPFRFTRLGSCNVLKDRAGPFSRASHPKRDGGKFVSQSVVIHRTDRQKTLLIPGFSPLYITWSNTLRVPTADHSLSHEHFLAVFQIFFQ